MKKTAVRPKRSRSTSKAISRNSWTRFCRTFSASNRYREARLQAIERTNDTPVLLTGGPLLGVSVSKKGRRIEGIDFFTDPSDPGAVRQPTVSIKEPQAIEILSEDESQTLSVRSAEGSTVELTVSNQTCDRHEVVRRLAYSLYERRQCCHGNDIGDWLSAERSLIEAEELLTS